MSPRSYSTKTSANGSNSPRRGREASVQDDSTPLRLSVAGGALGLETYRPLGLGPLVIEEFAWSLPSLKFPVDLSGGVDSFRHKRGELRHLVVQGSQLELERALSQKLRRLLGAGSGKVSLWPVNQGVGLGMWGDSGALAFELLWAPAGSLARMIVCNARTSGERDVPLAQALRVSDSLFGAFAKRSGRILTFTAVATELCQRLAPQLGTRAPAAHGATVSRLEEGEGEWRVSVDAALPPATLELRTVRALELAQLCSAADTAVAEGQLSTAREAYLHALERAPRHPELVELVAQIDAASGEERGEAALGMLVDCLPAAQFGAVGVTLLARTGDTTGAIRALEHTAAHEIYAPVAAELWLRLAEISESAEQQREALDRAVAAAPGLPSARWARFEARTKWQNEEGAIADAEHLEAAARGPARRHAVLLRCGKALVDVGLIASGGQIFERALRYLPDDPVATFGLARALLQANKTKRAITLLERAVSVSDSRGQILLEALVELAQQLAESGGDHPQAIARIVQVPASSPRLYLRAKALEGRWRAVVGDLKGASLAFAELREACEKQPDKPSIQHAARWLSEAAEFERRHLSEFENAERHLAEALRLSPHSRRIRTEYRQIAALALERRGGQ